MYGENRIEKITVRFTEQEKQQLKLLAEKNNMKISQLIREMIMQNLI
jgi:hypothetical protein